MFNTIVGAVKQLISGFTPWVCIAPWELALRVRVGKWVKLLKAGPHLRIPFMDRIYIQSVRLRYSSLGRLTLTPLGSVNTITLDAVLGYSIIDLEKLYRTLHHAEDSIRAIARSAVAGYVGTHSINECSPGTLEKYVTGSLDLERYGLLLDQLRITSFATGKVYRIVGDHGDYTLGAVLATDNYSATPQPAA